MKRNLKTSYVEDYKEVFNSASMLVLSKQGSLKVSETEELRRRCRERDVQVKVCKNSLMKLAIKDSPYEHLTEDFSGRVILAWSNDEVAVAKVLVDFQKASKNKLEVLKGGQGSVQLDATQITQLASLPSLPELRGKIIGIISSPAQKLALLMQTPASNLARLLAAKAGK